MEYLVKIDETMTHNLRIEAASPEEALEKGYQLLRDGLTPEEEQELDYSLDSDGFTGDNAVYPW